MNSDAVQKGVKAKISNHMFESLAGMEERAAPCLTPMQKQTLELVAQCLEGVPIRISASYTNCND